MSGIKNVKVTKSLQFTLSVILLAVTLGIMAIFLGYQYYSGKNKVMFDLDRATENTALRMSQYLANPMWAVEKHVIESLLDAEMLDNNIFGIIVYDSNGKAVVAGKGRNKNWGIYSTYDVFKKQTINRKDIIMKEHNIFMPGVKEQKLGVVKVFVTNQFEIGELNSFFTTNVLSVLIMILVLILAIAVSIRKLLLTPFEELIEATEKMSMGDLRTAIKTKSENEFGVLVESIERMRQSMIMAFQRLKKRQENR